MTDNKEIKIQIAPGAFDTFDGTQEELDALMEEIHKMFEGKSMEEIAELSRPISDEDFDELPDDVKLQLIRGHDDSEELPDEYKRKLQ
jgi:hypothetical protein